MKLIRVVLGAIILFFDRIFTPRGLQRLAPAQAKVEEATRGFVLYQLAACPFCVKVRREMKRLSVTFPLKEIAQDPAAHAELMAGGKLDQVPCLRMTQADGSFTWLYESSAIVEFLQNKFQNG
jgi:glutaredoxin